MSPTVRVLFRSSGHVAAVALAVLLTASQATAQQPPQDQPRYLKTDGEQRLEIVYKTVAAGDRSRELKLDLYYPTSGPARGPGEKHPVILYTHGGGWAAGSRYKVADGLFAQVFLRLLDEGFAVAPVSYRLAKEGVAIRDCVIDCKDAARYLATHADRLGLDPMRLGVMGDSAGGHLAQMLLLTDPQSLPGDADLVEARYRMLAGVSWYGPGDFERLDLFNHDDRPDFRDRFASRLLGSTTGPRDTGPQDRLARYREVSPVNFLTADSPPLLLIQGDRDTTIPVKHAVHMQQRAQAVGAPVDVLIVRNAGHNWRPVGADITPTRAEIVDRTVDFLVSEFGE